MLSVLMPISSPFTEQLATLGVHLPAWPEEPEGGGATGDWIQRGLAYAEGVRLWRAKLRNAPESTKGVVDQLLRHLHDTGQLGTWDQLLSAAIKPELQGAPDDERWQAYTRLVGSSELTPAQLLGMTLELARQGRLAAATDGLKRLLNGHLQMGGGERLQLCAELVAAANPSRLMNNAQSVNDTWEQAVFIHEQMTGLLREAMASEGADSPQDCTDQAINFRLLERLDAIINCLDREANHSKDSTIELNTHKKSAAQLAGKADSDTPMRHIAIGTRLETFPDIGKLRRIVALPTMLTRLESLRQSVESIIGQVDNIVLYLDSPEMPPPWLHGMEKVELVRLRPGTELHSEARFLTLSKSKKPFLFFSIDDDIIYPPDYIQNLTLEIIKAGGKAIVGVHGRIFTPPHQSYKNDSICYHFEKDLICNTHVHVLGCGTIGFISSILSFNPSSWPYSNMSDVQLSIEAQKKCIPRICIKRPKNWLRAAAQNQNDSIWGSLKRNDENQSGMMRLLLNLY